MQNPVFKQILTIVELFFPVFGFRFHVSLIDRFGIELRNEKISDYKYE